MGGFNSRQFQEMLENAQRQAQNLQEKMQQTVVEGSSGGGSVTVKMNGQKQVLDVKIEPQVFADKDQEMLQDLVRAAVNEASRRVDDELADQMKSLAGNMPNMAGLKIPGLF